MDQGIEGEVSDLFKVDPSIQLVELTRILWVCENRSFRHIHCIMTVALFCTMKSIFKTMEGSIKEKFDLKFIW